MNKIQLVLKQFNALNVRERVLTVAALLVILYFLLDLTLIRPQETRARQLRERAAQNSIEIETLRKSMESAAAQVKSDPLTSLRAELAALRSKSAQAEAVISRATGDVRLGAVMQALATNRPGIALTSIKTLPVVTLLQGRLPQGSVATVNKGMGQATQTLYRHGLEITVQGTYPALVQYLRDAERAANGGFWSSVKLTVVSYPNSSLVLTVFTLSTQADAPLG